MNLLTHLLFELKLNIESFPWKEETDGVSTEIDLGENEPERYGIFLHDNIIKISKDGLFIIEEENMTVIDIVNTVKNKNIAWKMLAQKRFLKLLRETTHNDQNQMTFNLENTLVV